MKHAAEITGSNSAVCHPDHTRDSSGTVVAQKSPPMIHSSNLERYLNDHLAGASGALQLLDDLAKRKNAPEESAFYRDLHDRVKSDFQLLADLLEKLDLSQDRLSQAGGVLSMKVGRLKMMWDGLNPPDLGFMEALEMLELGVSGKKLLWVALSEIKPHCAAFAEIDFDALIESATTQRDQLESRRLKVIKQTLLQSSEQTVSK